MDPSAVGVRLASGVVAPLVRKLFVKEGPGAGLVEKPVRISGLVSFKGEQRTLSDKDLRKLAAELVDRAVRTAGPGECLLAADEERAVADALATTLRGLGNLDMDDVQAVRLGATAPPHAWRRRARTPSAASPGTPSCCTPPCSAPPACTSCTSSPSGRPSWPAPWSSRAGAWTA